MVLLLRRQTRRREIMNTDHDLARFFSNNGEGKIVSFEEFMKFWHSLSSEERDYYRTAKLV
jgi:hypothetical protein